jgi:RNA polymerase sigma-70 factor (ECF subfamily)
MLRIAHNAAVSTLRRSRDQVTDPALLPDRPTLAADRVVEGREDLDRLRLAIDGLDDLSRSILVLRDVESMAYAEIAETLGVSVPLVKTRLLRARRELQRAVAEGVLQ